MFLLDFWKVKNLGLILGIWVNLDVFGIDFVRVLMLIICVYVWDCQLVWVFVSLGRFGVEKLSYCVLRVQTAVCRLGQTAVW